MRASIERYLNALWYAQKPVPLALRALEKIYRFALARRSAVALQSHMPVPVVVIGNLTAGGAGKTPLLIALVQCARARGLQVGVISAGYGRRGSATLRVGRDADWRDVGDEPLLIARRCNVPVCVAKDRMQAASMLMPECELLFADDGLQNPALQRAAEVLVIDGARGFGNGHLLPAGPLRQSADGYQQRYPLRVVHDAGAADDQASSAAADEYAWRMRLSGDQLLRLDGSAQEPINTWRGRTVHAIAGIGHPERFYAALRSQGLQPIAVPVPDHGHIALPRGDMAIVMTEKDALKYQPMSAQDTQTAWYVPVSASLQAPTNGPHASSAARQSGVDSLLDAILAQVRGVAKPGATGS
jgi:tetraacyldisaccharide 4'-kinase